LTPPRTMPLFQQEDVVFASHGENCHAWLYRPAAPAGPSLPGIVMAHGLGGTRDAGLAPYAQRFAAAGFEVLVFDYRHFGDSEGHPRQLVSIQRQLQDWRSAVTFARGLPGVDPDRIALWGSSFSGGHVIVVAAQDRQVAALSAQGPMMDGWAALVNFIGYAGVGKLLRLAGLGVLDLARALAGRSALTVPVIAKPGGLAAMSSPDAYDGYRALAPPDWRNELCARFALTLGTYRPIVHARRVACPALIQVCRQDSVAPAAAAVATARRLSRRTVLKIYDCGHFDIYVGHIFEQAVRDQLAFFERVLRPRKQPA
jgi:fermentation-respiration switch protein FrsA (DUF1100 family)